MEQAQQEHSVELLIASLARLGLHHKEAIAKVVYVAGQEALLLDEIYEHHPIQH